MKKKRKLYLIVFFMIAVFIIVFINITKEPKSEIYTRMKSHKKTYSSNYRLERAYREYSSSLNRYVMKFEFSLKKYDGWFKSVVKTYNSFLGEMNNEYKNDYIILYFSGKEYEGPNEEWFSITYIPENNYLEIFCSMRHAMKLSDLAKAFPDADKIELYTVEYGSIEEISGFKDLEVANFKSRLTEEEKEYILSLYPDCIVY
ncbi:MAG: hypothetical protein J6L77_03530 [Coprococcus sp.]|nr:hypothetical protein [Coprococcus sp.]